jgi:hypothetical protein
LKKLNLSVSGNKYEVTLEEDFADFVVRDLEESGIVFGRDNNPSNLLKAYLKIAKKSNSYEDELELLIETLDSL